MMQRQKKPQSNVPKKAKGKMLPRVRPSRGNKQIAQGRAYEA